MKVALPNNATITDAQRLSFGLLDANCGQAYPSSEYENCATWGELAEELAWSIEYLQTGAKDLQKVRRYCLKRAQQESE